MRVLRLSQSLPAKTSTRTSIRSQPLGSGFHVASGSDPCPDQLHYAERPGP